MANSGRDQMTSLTQIYGENLNKRFVLKGPQVLIGRNLKADIRLECPNVSRKHCFLIYSNDEWTIKDNGSQNGTYINGQMLKDGESKLLKCGDIIFLGPPAEMPQAFCVEVNYEYLAAEAEEFKSMLIETLQTVEETVISDLPQSKKEISSSKCPRKEKPGIIQELISQMVEEEILSSDLPSSKKEKTSLKCLKKGKSLKNTKFDDVSVAIVMEKDLKENSETDKSVASSTNFRHKRKAPSSSQQVFPTPKYPPKKSKIVVDFKPPESMDNNQVNEISSTEDDQVEDSLSLLDSKEEAEYHAFRDAINEPSCSHKIPSPEEKTENDDLKSQLALVAEELKKFKKEKNQFLKDMKKKNKTLAEQVAEKEKLKEELQNCELRAKNEIKKELLEKFGEDLVCIICSELLIKPSVLDCAHTFCEYCIKTWKKNKNECPMCRKRIETVTRVLTLDNFIENTVQTLTPEQREVREKLIKERQELEKVPKAPPRQRKQPGRRRRNQNTRNVDNRNVPRDSVEIIGESNVVFPYSLTTTMPSLPFLYNPNFRVPEVVRRSMDALNFYLT